MTDLRGFIRNVPDFPKRGIVFRDITTLLNDKKAFRMAVDEMCRPYQKERLDAIVGIESRGFIFGARWHLSSEPDLFLRGNRENYRLKRFRKHMHLNMEPML